MFTITTMSVTPSHPRTICRTRSALRALAARRPRAGAASVRRGAASADAATGRGSLHGRDREHVHARAISTLMTASGSSRFSRHLLKHLFSLVSPAGAVLFYFGASHFAGSNGVLSARARFLCWTFLCIAPATAAGTAVSFA